MWRRRASVTTPGSARRIRAALIGGLAIWFFLAFRLALIQLVHGPRLAELAESQQIVKVRLAPDRGVVYDRNMIPLTENLTVRSVCAYPDQVTSPRAAARELSRVLGGGYEGYLAKLCSDRSFVWIERQIDPAKAGRVEALDLAGVGLPRETKRVYPYAKRACHVLGLTDIDGQGIAGIECQMDTLLTGTEAWLCYCLDGEGHRTPTPSSTKVVPRDGRSVVLTIDLYLQSVAEVELERCIQEHGAARGTVIIQDPWTGEILAMANWPVFDPNAPSSSPIENQKNCAVTNQFEPGSTFKIVTACAALSTGAADLTSVYYGGRGSKRFDWFTIREAEDHEFGWVDFRQAFARSSNVCFAEIAAAVGRVVLFTFAREFGFGCLTGVELPGEVRGMLREPAAWSGRSTHTIGFGQEIAVTAVQLVSAYSAIANGGYLMEPRIVKAILADDGRLVEEARPYAVRQVIAPEVAALMRGLLLSVTEHGTGTRARVPEVLVGGKTGTAQKVVAGERRFSRDKHVASFVGMLPAEEPRLVCLVVIDEPDGKGFGGEVAAPTFARIMERILRGPCRDYILPASGRPGSDVERVVDRAVSVAPAALFARAEQTGERAEEIDTPAEGQPTPETEVLYADCTPWDEGAAATSIPTVSRRGPGTVVVVPPAGEAVVKVPDLRGMSVRLARRVASAGGLVLVFDGGGVVRDQSPRPGGFVRPGQKIIVACYPR